MTGVQTCALPIYGHESRKPQVRTAANGRNQRRQFLGSRTGFALFVGQLYLDHYFERLPHGVEPPSQLLRVHGFDSVEESSRNASFVGLQMPDQVILRTRQLAQQRTFPLELLDVVFAEDAQSQVIGLANNIGTKFLGDGDKCDFGSRATCLFAGPHNTLFYCFDSFTHTYCDTTAVEVPFALVSVTLTEGMVPVPAIVNGTVRVN
mgnify:CR=1 FL=1